LARLKLDAAGATEEDLGATTAALGVSVSAPLAKLTSHSR
jgi:hypothetical protein